MATYCSVSDLELVVADIASYDRKVTLPEYDFVTYSGSVMKLADSGTVAVLYEDGVNLGDPEASEIDVTSKGKWFYDSSADILYLFPSATITTERIQAAPESWPDAKASAIVRASQMLEAMVDGRFPRPIPKGAGNAYDQVIVQSCAILACIDLIESSSPADPLILTLKERLINDEHTGILERLNRGELRLHYEHTPSDFAEIAELSVDSATTGYPTDPQGTGAVDYEQVIITITAGGTVTSGTENTTVKYKTTDSQGVELVAETLINLYHQPTGLSSVRFVAGVYTTGDTWTITSNANQPETGVIKQVSLSR